MIIFSNTKAAERVPIDKLNEKMDGMDIANAYQFNCLAATDDLCLDGIKENNKTNK